MTDYEQTLISALRYALGRRSYIVKVTTDYMAAEIPKLSEHCKSVMIESIEDQKKFGYGDACDKEDWMSLLDKLKASTTSPKIAP